MNTGSFKTTLSSQSLFFHINYVNSTGHSLLYRVAPVTDASHVLGAVQLKCDGTRWRTGGEVKGKLANGVGCQYSSHYLETWCIQHYYRWCA